MNNHPALVLLLASLAYTVALSDFEVVPEGDQLLDSGTKKWSSAALNHHRLKNIYKERNTKNHHSDKPRRAADLLHKIKNKSWRLPPSMRGPGSQSTTTSRGRKVYEKTSSGKLRMLFNALKCSTKSMTCKYDAAYFFRSSQGQQTLLEDVKALRTKLKNLKNQKPRSRRRRSVKARVKKVMKQEMEHVKKVMKQEMEHDRKLVRSLAAQVAALGNKVAVLPRCNWKCYLKRYADLRAAFGQNLAKAEEHYRHHGRKEGRDCMCRP